MRHGIPADKARAYARLGVATPRGLLLDLLATGDGPGVDEAMKCFIASYEPLWTCPAPSSPRWNSPP